MRPAVHRIVLWILASGIGPALCGCTADQLYREAQYAARAECEKLISVSDRQRCLQANSMSKDQYEAERAKGGKRE